MSTRIEWTRGDDGTPGETWNPTVGCSRVSPGCGTDEAGGCYAERQAAMRARNPALAAAYEGVVESTPDGPRWTGRVNCLPDRLDIPLRWRKPRRVFVDSMSDLFHPQVPDEFIGSVWATMRDTPQHTYQVLTKRPRRMASFLSNLRTFDGESFFIGDRGDEFILPNVWLGTSVEDQHQADRRIPHLLATPAAVRFLSCEPLLGPIDLGDISDERSGSQVDALCCDEGPEDAGWIGTGTIGWVIVGGESGPRARPMHPEWARGLRDQCVAAGVPFFFKQWGRWTPGPVLMSDDEALAAGAICVDIEDGTILPWNQEPLDSPAATMIPAGKKAAGRVLDGRTWDQYPETVPA